MVLRRAARRRSYAARNSPGVPSARPIPSTG
jgi:hypothetical protein